MINNWCRECQDFIAMFNGLCDYCVKREEYTDEDNKIKSW